MIALDWVPLTTPMIVVATLFFATIVPALFNLKSDSGYPTIFGWIFLAIVIFSCTVAFQKELDQAEHSKLESARFTELLSNIDRQQKIIGVGDITVHALVRCNSNCGDPNPALSIRPRKNRLMIDGILEIANVRQMSESDSSILDLSYVGKPLFTTLSGQSISTDELEGARLELFMYRVPDHSELRSVALYIKGRIFRAQISKERSGASPRYSLIFRITPPTAWDESGDD